jgi:hypothetical protein
MLLVFCDMFLFLLRFEKNYLNEFIHIEHFISSRSKKNKRCTISETKLLFINIYRPSIRGLRGLNISCSLFWVSNIHFIRILVLLNVYSIYLSWQLHFVNDGCFYNQNNKFVRFIRTIFSSLYWSSQDNKCNCTL